MRSIAVVGLGSMGKRRIRLSRAISADFQIVGVDSREDRRAAARKEFGIATTHSIADAVASGIDCALVCTSPMSHASLLHELIGYGMPAFSELNLLQDGYDEFVAHEKEAKLFLSSTFLYRKDVCRIISEVGGRVANYTYHSGQYLPDWHPWESYRDFFVSNKLTNGCREILAIELPWLIKAFGPIESLSAIRHSLTTLDLDYPDSYSIQVLHKNGSVGQIAVDVSTRVATREFEAFSEDLLVRWSGKPDSLRVFDETSGELRLVNVYQQVEQDSRYSANIVENAYQEELEAFYRWVFEDDWSLIRYSYADDRATLSLIDEIEHS